MLLIAKNIVTRTNYIFIKQFTLTMNIRNIKPVIPKLVTDNLAK